MTHRDDGEITGEALPGSRDLAYVVDGTRGSVATLFRNNKVSIEQHLPTQHCFLHTVTTVFDH